MDLNKQNSNFDDVPVEIITPGYNILRPPVPAPKKQVAFDKQISNDQPSFVKNNQDQYNSKDIENSNLNGMNYFVNQKNQKNIEENNDPDAWDPPSPPKYENIRKRQPVKWNKVLVYI